MSKRPLDNTINNDITNDYFRTLPPHQYYPGALVVVNRPVLYSTADQPDKKADLFQLCILKDITVTTSPPTQLSHFIFHLNPVGTQDISTKDYYDNKNTIIAVIATAIRNLKKVRKPIERQQEKNVKLYALRRNQLNLEFDWFFHHVIVRKVQEQQQNPVYWVTYYEDHLLALASSTKKDGTGGGADRKESKQFSLPIQVSYDETNQMKSLLNSLMEPEPVDIKDVWTAFEWYEQRRLHQRKLELNLAAKRSQKASKEGVGKELQALYNDELVQLPMISNNYSMPGDNTNNEANFNTTKQQQQFNHDQVQLIHKVERSHISLSRFAMRYCRDIAFWRTQQLPRIVTLSSLRQILTTIHTSFNSLELVTKVSENGFYNKILIDATKSRQQQLQLLLQRQQLHEIPFSPGQAIPFTSSNAPKTKKDTKSHNDRMVEYQHSRRREYEIFLQKQTDQINARSIKSEVLFAPRPWDVEAMILPYVLTFVHQPPVQKQQQQQQQNTRNNPNTLTNNPNNPQQQQPPIQNNTNMNQLQNTNPQQQQQQQQQPQQQQQQQQRQHPQQRPRGINQRHMDFLIHQSTIQGSNQDFYLINAFGDKTWVEGFHGAKQLFPPNSPHTPARTMWGLFNDISVFHPWQRPRAGKGEWSLYVHPYLHLRQLFDRNNIFIAHAKERLEMSQTMLRAHHYLELIQQQQLQQQPQLRRYYIPTYEELLKANCRIYPHKMVTLPVQHTPQYTTHRVYQLQNHERVNDQIEFLLNINLSANNNPNNTNTNDDKRPVPLHYQQNDPFSPNTRHITPEHYYMEIYAKQLNDWQSQQGLPQAMRSVQNSNEKPAIPKILQTFFNQQNPPPPLQQQQPQQPQQQQSTQQNPQLQHNPHTQQQQQQQQPQQQQPQTNNQNIIAHDPFITPLPMFHPIVPLPNLTTLVNIQNRAPWALIGTSLPSTAKYEYCNPYLPDEAQDLPTKQLDKFVYNERTALGNNIGDYCDSL